MFLIFNKEKIYSYIVATFAVIGMLCLSNVYLETEESIQTAVNATSKLVPIYNVQTKEKNVAFTMNCAWSADDIDQILEVLKQNEVNITFFCVGDWVEKYPDAVHKISEAGHEIRKSFRYTSTCKQFNIRKKCRTNYKLQ